MPESAVRVMAYDPSSFWEQGLEAEEAEEEAEEEAQEEAEEEA